MKKLALFLSLFLLPSLVFATTTTVQFGYTNATSSWTVPTGVTSIVINVRGAKGGVENGKTAGLGGSSTGTLTVIAGQTYYFCIGGTVTSTGQTAGGLCGGGPDNHAQGEGGGGMTWFSSVSRFVTSSVIIVGAGGGGTSFETNGGDGGGTSGSNGGGGTEKGSGGTQTAGGAAGIGGSGQTAGSEGQGGGSTGTRGGGGGGGYFGGGGGGDSGTAGGGGGGGSSFTTSTLVGTSTASGVASTSSLTIYYTTSTPINPSIALSTTTYNLTTTNSSATETITNVGAAGAASLSWAITSTQPWLTFDVQGGTLAQGVSSSVNFISSLWGYAPGTYNATASISDTNALATNTPQTASITAVVNSAGGGSGGASLSCWFFN